MTDPRPGLFFRETMKGAFALGFTDPAAGAEAGRRAGTELAMHASITIDDMQRFIDDPAHAGHIIGTVDFAPLGMGLVATRGVFNLFSPTDAPGTKHMVYELAFELDGKPHYLAGHKIVRNDRGLDLWSDTTTLVTTLHAGHGKSAPVIGAGVLGLGVAALKRLLTTVRPLNTTNPIESARVIAQFGTFFSKELFDSYVRTRPGTTGVAGVGGGAAGHDGGDGTPRWDVIVIGSGFGGAVTACRLAEAGMRVLVLERGRRWAYDRLPRSVDDDGWWWDPNCPERHNGWVDMRLFPKMGVVQGAAVGGGSQIYANISVEAPAAAFASGWPEGINHAALKPYYDRVGAFMDVAPVPANQIPERTRLMAEGARAIGAGDRFRQVELAVSFAKEFEWKGANSFDTSRSQRFTNRHGVEQGTCIHCGMCDIGCQVKAKNTLDLNYLAVAERHGCEIRPLHLVSRLEPLDGGGYAVHFDRLDKGRRTPGREVAERVVVAAGSLGSTELLLRCRDEFGTLRSLSPRLGASWCSNGDFLTPAFYTKRTLNPSRGPTITSAIDFLDGSRGGHRFWVQDGGVPDLLDAWLQHYVSRKPKGWFQRLTQKWVKERLVAHDPARNMMPWFAQGMDHSDGTFRLRRRWLLFGRRELRLDWDLRRSEALFRTIVDTHKELATATGGTPLVPPTWTLAKYLVTPHPLGGCGMADSADRGVVDQRGEVYGHEHLFVIDGAMFPTSVGVNPSRTIAALAERCAERIIADGR